MYRSGSVWCSKRDCDNILQWLIIKVSDRRYDLLLMYAYQRNRNHIKQPEKLTLHLHAQRQAYIYTSIIVCFTLQLSYNSVLFSPIYPNK